MAKCVPSADEATLVRNELVRVLIAVQVDPALVEAKTGPKSPTAISLNADNVSKWFNGPYQDYLAALEWRDELQQLRDHALSFGQEEGSVRFQEGVVQIGLTQIFRAMKENHFKDDAANSLRLFNSLARLSREALVIRKYADQQAQQKAVELRKLDVHRKMNAAEEMAMQDRADDFFGWKSAARLKLDLQSDCSSRREEAESIPQSKIQNQNSKIPSAPSPSPTQEERDGERRSFNRLPEPVPSQASETVADVVHPEGTPEGPSSSSPVVLSLEDQKSQTENGKVLPAIENQNSQTEEPERSVTDNSLSAIAASPQIKNQKSKIENAEELCYDCGAPLPHLLPNGQRPAAACISCGARLYPSGTTFDHCHCCQAAQPILLTGERAALVCRRCNSTLSPPGQRFVSHCPACGFELPPLTADGTRISDRCPDCRAPLPLLESASVAMNTPFPIPGHVTI